MASAGPGPGRGRTPPQHANYADPLGPGHPGWVALPQGLHAVLAACADAARSRWLLPEEAFDALSLVAQHQEVLARDAFAGRGVLSGSWRARGENDQPSWRGAGAGQLLAGSR